MLSLEVTRCRATEDDIVESCGSALYAEDAWQRSETDDIEADVPGLFALALCAANALWETGTTEDNGRWYSDPDGTHVVDYSDGMREETTARFMWNGQDVETAYPLLAAMISAANVRRVGYRPAYRSTLTHLHWSEPHWLTDRRAALYAETGV